MALSNSIPTLNAGILMQLVRYLKHINVDSDEVLCLAGVDPKLLMQPDRRISVDAYNKAEEAAAEKSSDRFFGLHMGQFFEPGSWSILGYLMMNCKTLGEAMIKAGKYYKIIGLQIHSTVRIKNRNLQIFYVSQKNGCAVSRHCYESAISSTVCLLRTLSRENVTPIAVGLKTAKPPCSKEYQNVFGSPVLFGQKSYSLTLPLSIVKLPVVCPNQKLLSYFEEYIHQFLAELEDEKPVTNEVVKLLMSVLDNKSLSIADVAKQMAMSKRTLQNRLKEENTSFRCILEDTRIRLSKKYIRENRTAEDISFLLGFKDPSVFRKAFKKWTGYTPGEYRLMS